MEDRISRIRNRTIGLLEATLIANYLRALRAGDDAKAAKIKAANPDLLDYFEQAEEDGYVFATVMISSTP